jgi:hypothetical protein
MHRFWERRRSSWSTVGAVASGRTGAAAIGRANHRSAGGPGLSALERQAQRGAHVHHPSRGAGSPHWWTSGRRPAWHAIRARLRGATATPAMWLTCDYFTDPAHDWPVGRERGSAHIRSRSWTSGAPPCASSWRRAIRSSGRCLWWSGWCNSPAPTARSHTSGCCPRGRLPAFQPTVQGRLHPRVAPRRGTARSGRLPSRNPLFVR